VFRCVLGSEGCVLVPRFSGTPVAKWAWPTWVVSRRRVLEAVFILLEFPSPSRRIFIGSHSLPPLWFAVSVLQLGGWPRQERAGEDAQAPLGRAGASPRCQSHPGGGDQAVPCSRSPAAPEAAASPLRDDGRSGPLGGDRDRTVAPVIPRGPASCGAGDREIDLLVAVIMATPDAPQRGDIKNCKLFIFLSCLVRLLSWHQSSRSLSFPANVRALLSL
jgi:hypothetical protein